VLMGRYFRDAGVSANARVVLGENVTEKAVRRKK
jgi:hypothetical protein